MRRYRYSFLIFGLMLTATIAAAASAAEAGDLDARALVNKAVQAHGGQAALDKFPAFKAKLKGTLQLMGETVAFTGRLAASGKDRQKLVIEAKAGDEKFVLVHVLNRDQGWTKINDDTEEMDKEDLAEARAEAYAEWVTTLAPLKDKAFKLAFLSELKIDQRPALGITVSKKGHRDVHLYFDKKTSLLVKTETRVKDDNNNQEVTEETMLSNYKEVQGTKQAMRFITRRDGKLYMEGEITEYVLAEKLDERTFAKP
jgi:hypothetical protein